MYNRLTVGYDLSAVGNHGYFFEDAPDSVFCDKCGCCIDDDYLSEDLKVGNRCDIGYTYDGRPITSLRFKEYIEGLALDVDFFQLIRKKLYF